MNFKSKSTYKRWLAYGHVHKLFEKVKGVQPVRISGRDYKPKHTK